MLSKEYKKLVMDLCNAPTDAHWEDRARTALSVLLEEVERLEGELAHPGYIALPRDPTMEAST